MDKNVVGWFEIPVLNLNRAITFYSEVFGWNLEFTEMAGIQMAPFPAVPNGDGASGALVYDPLNSRPVAGGVLIYFRSPSGNAEIELGRIEHAGGKVLLAKTLISRELGYYGFFLDSEGNHLGIHSYS